MTALTTSFDAVAATDFGKSVRDKFGKDTLQKVYETFHKMGLPLPVRSSEYLDATEGVLMFMNKYGLVIRIENANGAYGNRCDHSPWVLQPLGVVAAGNAIIEICPGCHVGTDKQDIDFLKKNLKMQKIDYWDNQISNGGRLPIKMPSFPDGVPVVIDRMAVETLEYGTVPVANALALKQRAEAEEAQKNLYEPLRTLLREGWSDPAQMKKFWDACVDHKRKQKLISGWMQKGKRKTELARKCSEKYAHRLKGPDPLTRLITKVWGMCVRASC